MPEWLYPTEFFEAIGEVRDTSSVPYDGGGSPYNTPDVKHYEGTWALAAMLFETGSLDDSIRSQRELLANALTLIGLDVIEADDVDFIEAEE